MRIVGRVFVAARSAGVDAQVAVARAAEAHGLEGVWVHGPASGHGDSYATTTAAAVASVTTHLRVGVVLRLAAPDDILRLAEDVAVLDHCSSGRAEICLDGRWAADQDGGPTWSADAARMLTNLRTCSVGDRELAVTPGPLQPTIPSVALGPGVPVAGIGTVASIGAGDAATGASGDAAPGASGDAAPGASSDAATGASGGSALPSYVPAGTVGYLTAEHTSALLRAATGADSLRTAIERLRADIHRSGVRDVVFVVPADSVDEDVATLASVVAPILRANEDEVADLVLDVLKFRAARAGFEQRAARAGSV